MQNKKAKKQRWSLEKTFLVACAAILAVMVVSAWGSVALLRSTIASYGENVDKDVNALIEIERIRNMGETKTAGARAWFLLGSKAIFDEQAQLKKDYEAALAGFEKRLPLPQVPEIIKKL
ncbi:MAG TPA: hypothetical protein VFV50_12760, partial [Bdellovibrionales bacterium]|nr:hypothetical protein [Bdellovibrionales bacterium]